MSKKSDATPLPSAFGVMPNLLADERASGAAPSDGPAPVARPAAASDNASDEGAQAPEREEGSLASAVNDSLTKAEQCVYQAAAALASGGDAAHSLVRARRELSALRGLLALD